MKYWWESVRTTAYWRYALFSGEAIAKFFSALGVLYLLINLADTFKIYEKGQYSNYGILILIALAIIFVIFTRRPVSRVSYKVPKKDYTFEVKISDLFKESGEIIISSNTTFDTDMSSGLISTNSLQGQFATQFFNGQTIEIDRQIEESLASENYIEVDGKPGKRKKYPLGTVARVSAHGKNFYFLAMSDINSEGTAFSNVRMLDEALEGLWSNMARKGELGDVIMPLMGTGRGRVAIPRKKIIERIAQSFADASQEQVFSNKLSIIVRPEDASKFSLNLFQVRDYLSQSLNA